MNSILSLFVCLAMLLSGGAYSATPDAASSRTITISDVTFAFNGEEYALDPTASFGVKTENGAALLDFALNCGGDKLFPIQAKLDDTGATVLISDASTAYTFTPELMDLDEAVPAEIKPALDAYMRLLLAMPSVIQQQDAVNAASSAALAEALADMDIPVTETTYTVDGVELPAQHAEYTIDEDMFVSMLDAGLAVYEGDFFDAYVELLNYTMQMSAAELDDGTPMPEFTKFTDLFTLLPMDMSMDCSITLTEDTIGEADFIYNISIDADGEQISLALPMHADYYGPETVSQSMEFELPEDMGSMTVESSVDGGLTSMSMGLDIADGDMPISMNMDMVTTENEDGSTDQTFGLRGQFDGDEVAFQIDSKLDDQGLGVSNIGISGTADGVFFSLSFRVTITGEDIADRIAGANITTLTTEEELESASTSMMLSIAGLASDVEKLMADPSVAALSELMDSMTDYDEYVEPTGDDDPSALSFAIPAFNLPEGYELTEQSIYGEYDSAELTYEYTGEDTSRDYATINISLYSATTESGNYTYLMGEDGTLSLSDSPVFSIYQTDGYFSASTTLDDCSCYISCYDGPFTVEDLTSLISGI